MDTEQRIKQLEMEVQDLRYILSRKTGLGSADIKGGSVGSSAVAANSITNTKMADDAIKQAELDYEQVNVTVSAGNSSGTAGVTSGSIIIGWRATGNQDQFVDNMAVSGTTLTITLAANATADNTFQVTLLKS